MLHRAPKNQLLAALAAHQPNVYDSLIPNLKGVPLKKDHALFAAREAPTRGWSLKNGAAVVLAKVERRVIEAAMVGGEGAVGLSSIAGTNGILLSAQVQIEGKALEIDTSTLHHALRQNGETYDLISNYVNELFGYFALVSICNRFHSTRHRLASKLLLMREYRRSNTVSVTHTSLARLVGGAPSVVTRTVVEFRQLKWIGSRRGRITILKRGQLEQTARGCHTFVHHDKHISSVGASP